MTYLAECIIKRNQVLISQGGTGEQCRGAAQPGVWACGGMETVFRSGQVKERMKEKGHSDTD